MKTTIATIAFVLASTAAAFAAPMASDGLYTLATTGWADDYAAETNGSAFDKTGGTPGAFTYSLTADPVVNGYIQGPLDAARALLGEGEFLAPHFSISGNGDITIMVAPHLLVDGEVVKGANTNEDHFIVISGGEAERFDYSVDVEGGM